MDYLKEDTALKYALHNIYNLPNENIDDRKDLFVINNYFNSISSLTLFELINLKLASIVFYQFCYSALNGLPPILQFFINNFDAISTKISASSAKTKYLKYKRKYLLLKNKLI
jgi:hypothetical protein